MINGNVRINTVRASLDVELDIIRIQLRLNTLKIVIFNFVSIISGVYSWNFKA